MADSLFTPTEVPQDLDRLEKSLHQLAVDYELFFLARADGKTNVLPPHRRIAEVEALVRHYTRHPPHRTVDRFRFNTLVHRYRTSAERWSRRMRVQEEQGLGRQNAGRREVVLDTSRPQVLAATRAGSGVATGGQVRDLFVAFRKARRARGQDVSELSYAAFADRLAARLDEARSRAPGADLELRVDEVGGKVRVAVCPLAPRDAEAVPATRGARTKR